jgi:conjugal transfer pilus assembly protein TraD
VTRAPSGARADPFDGLTGPVLAAAALAVVAPAAAAATTVAWLIDRRGWRRWPALLAGAVATTLVATLGGWAAARHALALLASRASRGPTLGAADVVWIAALQVAAGLGAAPILLVVTHHRDDHETTSHQRQMSRRRRAEVQAERVLTRARWPTPPDRTVLGVRLEGGVTNSTARYRTQHLVAVPLADWGRQALIVGETGSGKTVTALTVASEAMRLGWDVYWIDGKADRDVAERFLTMARHRGLRPADGSHDPIDGWRGTTESIVNRLLATQRFTEPYYAGIARNVLKWAVTRPGPPRSFAELVARLDQRALRRAWRDSPDEADKIRAMAATDFLGARYRYEGVAWAVGATLDGDWSYEDVRAAYVPVGRPEHRDQAEEVGAFLLEDLLHWAMARKSRHRRALVVVDEFSKLAARPDAAVELVERVRSFGVGVALIGQTWASLGRSDAVRDRLAGTVGTVVVHQLKQPDRLVELAGSAWTMERTEQIVGQTPTGRATQRPRFKRVVEPDDVRALRTGEAFIIRGGQAVKVRVRTSDTSRAPANASR